KKLGKVAVAYQRLPDWLRQRVPTVKDSTTEIAFENGSSIQVGTSHRGGTLRISWSGRDLMSDAQAFGQCSHPLGAARGKMHIAAFFGECFCGRGSDAL